MARDDNTSSMQDLSRRAMNGNRLSFDVIHIVQVYGKLVLVSCAQTENSHKQKETH
jgi:hypothetical protein